MTISGCVVLYNPKSESKNNIYSYLDFLDLLFVMDNSTKYNEELVAQLQSNPKIFYVNMGGNKGIAQALKDGLALSIERGFDLCLTMDQDSIFPQITKSELYARFDAIDNLGDYGIIGLNFNSDVYETGLIETNCWITSGNFIVLENYKKIHGFKPELFIDYVDFDLDEQFKAINKKVAYWIDLSLQHTIGNPKKYKIFKMSFTVMNHSPIRYYYRFRNSSYLYHKNKRFYKRMYFHDLLIDIPKIILFEKTKIKKIKMIHRGRRDAKLGILGEYRD